MQHRTKRSVIERTEKLTRDSQISFFISTKVDNIITKSKISYFLSLDRISMLMLTKLATLVSTFRTSNKPIDLSRHLESNEDSPLPKVNQTLYLCRTFPFPIFIHTNNFMITRELSSDLYITNIIPESRNLQQFINQLFSHSMKLEILKFS